MATMNRLAGARRKTACGLGAAALVLSASVGGVSADTAQSIAIASVGAQLAVREATPMRFGTVAPPAESATVELTPLSATVNCGLSRIGGERALAASVALRGAPNQTFSVALPTRARMGGASGIDVATFVHDAGPTPTIDRSGAVQFRIGATLFVAEKTSSGVYSGSFDVIVSNN